jgi:hypothetical protein
MSPRRLLKPGVVNFFLLKRLVKDIMIDKGIKIPEKDGNVIGVKIGVYKFRRSPLWTLVTSVLFWTQGMS